jgi:hypothetical protein
MRLTYLVVGDGTTEAVLIPVLNWLIRQTGYTGDLEGQCCDFRLFRREQGKPLLTQRVGYGLRLYRCDLLFVHRDAERASRETRLREIEAAIDDCRTELDQRQQVCVVPIRMTEAWLMFDESAIRHAVGNANGRIPLQLPLLSSVEGIAMPKNLLHSLIREASELSSRRRDGLPISHCVRMIPEYIEDFAPLRTLTAFARLEKDIRDVFLKQGWTV